MCVCVCVCVCVIKIKQLKTFMILLKIRGPLSWGYRIHRLPLCLGVRLSQRVSCL